MKVPDLNLNFEVFTRPAQGKRKRTGTPIVMLLHYLRASLLSIKRHSMHLSNRR